MTAGTLAAPDPDNPTHQVDETMFQAKPIQASAAPRVQRRPFRNARSSSARRSLSPFEDLLLLLPSSGSDGAVRDHAVRAAKACELCAAECSLILLQDIFLHKHDHGARPQASTLLACAEECRRMRELLARLDPRVLEHCSACARACRECRVASEKTGVRWAALAAVCEQCEACLADLAAVLEAEAAQAGAETV